MSAFWVAVAKRPSWVEWEGTVSLVTRRIQVSGAVPVSSRFSRCMCPVSRLRKQLRVTFTSPAVPWGSSLKAVAREVLWAVAMASMMRVGPMASSVGRVIWKTV